MLDDIKTSKKYTTKDDMQVNFMAVKTAPQELDNHSPGHVPKTPPQKKRRLRNMSLTKKQKIIVGIAALIIAVTSIGGVLWFASKKPAEKQAEQPATEQAPPKTTEPSRLTGIEGSLEINKRTVTGIMIENSPDARPQSGLKDAGVIYEAVAEGGITRFLALFQDTVPEYIGPVRSVRPYYLDFLAPYKAAIAHVGGSAQALAEIKAEGIRDLDQFANPGPYWRESSRFAPHNMYTNLAKLKDTEQQKGWTASEYEGFIRGGASEPSPAPNAKGINVRMSRPLYDVAYQYDATTNTYLRNVGGRPHLDAKSGTQLAPKLVVVPVIPRSQSGIYSVYAVNGSGKLYVFQNGTVTEGTWTKANRSSQFKFTGTDGQPIKLAPGQTWVTIAAAAGDVAITP
jgi:hypothetical protein